MLIPGVLGRLLPWPFLGEIVTTAVDEPGARDAHRRFRDWHRAVATLGPASALRAIAEVAAVSLSRVLEYSPAGIAELPGDALSLDLVHPHDPGRRLPMVVAPWGGRLDRWRRAALLAARARQSRWVLLFNGTHLRLLDAGATALDRNLTVDLAIAAAERSCFVVCWSLDRAAMTLPEPSPVTALVARGDAFAAGVGRSLRDGVLAASGHVTSAFCAARSAARDADLEPAFEQSLIVVYRMLFLLFAESRHLVPTWHPVYRQSYTLASLRLLAEQGRRTGLWEAFRAICRLAHSGCRMDDLAVTAFNGRLFDGRRVPLVERQDLDDEAARQAILALTTREAEGGRGRESITYQDLGVEQLGAIYETLLDYRPRLRPAPGAQRGRTRPRPAVALEHGSGARKSSGSYYTPQPVAQFLVRGALEPLVSGKRPDEILSLKVLDPASGSGAFLVAACHYLASAYEDALVATGACAPDDVSPADRAGFRRAVAERCLYGVDLNPMAVQLTKLSLWLTTLAWDKPLSFLDHHVRSGDSLLGAWVASLSRPPVARRRTPNASSLPLFEGTFDAAARVVLPQRLALSASADTLAAVRGKERTLAALEREDSVLSAWRRVADIWCAQWFAGHQAPSPSAFQSLAAAIVQDRQDRHDRPARHDGHALPAHVSRPLIERMARVAAAHRFFHWELEFPEVFFDAEGHRLARAGFDAVIGNPPWDMMRADEGGDRQPIRAALDLVRQFVKQSGMYEAAGDGHGNRYQLFVERGIDLLRQGGRLAMVLPAGLATDHGSRALRRFLFERCTVDGLVGFDNRRAIFPIHRGVRFLLLTGTKGSPTRTLGLRLGENDPSILAAEDSGSSSWYSLRVPIETLQRVGGHALPIPDWRRPLDLSIADRAASRFAPLGSASGWGAHFGRELNATDDRGSFAPPGRGLPVLEGKHLEPFQVHLDRAAHALDRRVATRRLGERWRRVRLAYRDVASAANRQTLIAAILPADCVSTHTLFCLRHPMPLVRQQLLCALFNSLIVNYLVRQRVTTHVTTAIVEGLPMPQPSEPTVCDEIVTIARQCTRNGYETDVRRFGRLNALVAGLFGLAREELRHVLGTFPLVPEPMRNGVLASFDALDPR